MNANDLTRFSKAVLELQGCPSLDELGPTLIRVMQALCDVDFPIVNTVQGDKLLIYASEHAFPDEWMEVFNARIQEHPLIGLIARKTGEPTWAGRWSDFTTLRRFQQTGLYHDFFRLRGIRRQLATTMDVNGENIVALAFNRTGSDFRPEDAHLVEMILPHVRSTIENLISRMEMEEALAWRDLTLNDRAVMLVDEGGALVFATERARELARDFFEIHAVDGLPVEIRSWLEGSPASGALRTWHRPDRRLSCRCGSLVRLGNPRNEFWLGKGRSLPVRSVFLTEHCEKQSKRMLLSLGLTPREAEVLHWMAEGKRNGEIAVILGISERTVDKHRENLFAKLGVETRTAAVAAAQSVTRFHH